MKKPVRLLLLGTGLLVAGLLLLTGLAFHSGVQTWAARKALAKQPALKASVGKVSAGFQTVALSDLQFEQDGAVIMLPSFIAEFSVIDAGLNEKISLRRLVVKGWTLDLTNYAFPAASAIAVTGKSGAGATVGGGANRPATAVAAPAGSPAIAPAAVAAQIFQGIFAQAVLPFELTLDGVELEGDVKLPPSPGITSGSAHVVLKGGGLAAGHEGAFTFDVAVALAGPDVPVSSLTVVGRLAAAMDTARTFNRLATQAEAAATGPQFPQGVKLATDIAAARTATGETYAISLSDGARLLAGLKADLPSATHHLSGTWKLGLRDADLAPFTLGRPLPNFALMGEGQLDFDVATADVRATGKLDAFADKLGVLKPELAAVGLVKLVSEFDLARHGEGVRVERLAAAFSAGHPVATVTALQPFEFNGKTGELKVADPSGDLLGLDLQAVPVAWVRPWLKDIVATGGDVRGEVVAIARNGGFALRPKASLVVTGLSVTRGGKPLVHAVDVSLNASADYTPQGWQAEIVPLIVKSGAATVLNFEAKAGQLTGKDQPVKATGRFASNLPALLAQPVASGFLQLTAGEATGDFAVSLDGKKEVMLKLALDQLAADPAVTKETLPTVRIEARADVAASGVITLNAPLALERDGRKSDLTLTGTVTPGKTGTVFDAHATSTMLTIDDAQVLAGVLAPPPAPAPKIEAKDAAPPWAGLSGQLSLALKKVVYSDTLQVSDVTGTLSLEAGAAKLVNFRAGLGEGASAKIDGNVTFDAKSKVPYALTADLTVNEFDPARLFKALNPGRLATVEGKFTVGSTLTGRAARLADFATTTHGDFQLASRGGVFRGLPVSYAPKVEAAGKLAASAAAIGSLLSSMSWKKDYSGISNKVQAVAEVCKTLAVVPYDQLSVVFSRDAACNTVLKDFTLIAPELRLSGGGVATHREGAPLLDDSLAMEFKLRARGRMAEVCKYLGKLDAATDELGYSGCTVPLKIGGTLGCPETTEANATLAGLAVEKPGVTEKATELFNKFLGGGK